MPYLLKPFCLGAEFVAQLGLNTANPQGPEVVVMQIDGGEARRTFPSFIADCRGQQQAEHLQGFGAVGGGGGEPGVLCGQG